MNKNEILKMLKSDDSDQVDEALDYVYDDLETMVQDDRFEDLQESQKIVFVALSFFGLVGNGGFYHFLASEGYGEYFPMVADSLRAIGLDNMQWWLIKHSQT